MKHLKTFGAELRDAVVPRTFVLVLGALVLTLGFIASYVGAFHDPGAHEIAVGVVGQDAAAVVVDELNSLDSNAVVASVYPDRATLVEQIKSGEVVAGWVVDSGTTTDELLIASGGGSSLVTVVEQVAATAADQQGRTFTITDVVPLEEGDARGLTGFYATIGWIIGGYLMAALMGVARGARPANPRRAAIRLAVSIPYALAAGIGGALIMDQWLGALTGHFWAIAGLGTLLVLTSAAVTTALQVLFGTMGVGLTVLVFVVLGNPSAGGAFQWQTLPEFWSTIGPWLPNGAGTDAIRHIVYFGGHGVAEHVWLIVGYLIVGVVATMAGAIVFHSRETRAPGVDEAGPRVEELPVP